MIKREQKSASELQQLVLPPLDARLDAPAAAAAGRLGCSPGLLPNHINHLFPKLDS